MPLTLGTVSHCAGDPGTLRDIVSGRWKSVGHCGGGNIVEGGRGRGRHTGALDLRGDWGKPHSLVTPKRGALFQLILWTLHSSNRSQSLFLQSVDLRRHCGPLTSLWASDVTVGL